MLHKLQLVILVVLCLLYVLFAVTAGVDCWCYGKVCRAVPWNIWVEIRDRRRFGQGIRLWYKFRHNPISCARCFTPLHKVRSCEPYTDAHLICPKCDSTYNL